MGHATTRRTIFCIKSYACSLSFLSVFSTWLFLLCFYHINIVPLPMHGRCLGWWSVGLGQLSHVNSSTSTSWKVGGTFLKCLLSNGLGGDPGGEVLATEVHTFCMLPDSLTQPFLPHWLANSVVRAYASCLVYHTSCLFPHMTATKKSTGRWARVEWHRLQTQTR